MSVKESTVIESGWYLWQKTHIIKISKEDNHYNNVKSVNKEKKKSNIKQTKKSMGLEVKIISSNIPPNCKAFIQRQEMIKP